MRNKQLVSKDCLDLGLIELKLTDQEGSCSKDLVEPLQDAESCTKEALPDTTESLPAASTDQLTGATCKADYIKCLFDCFGCFGCLMLGCLVACPVAWCLVVSLLGCLVFGCLGAWVLGCLVAWLLPGLLGCLVAWALILPVYKLATKKYVTLSFCLPNCISLFLFFACLHAGSG